MNFSKENATAMSLLTYNKRGMFFRKFDITEHTSKHITSEDQNVICFPP